MLPVLSSIKVPQTSPVAEIRPTSTIEGSSHSAASPKAYELKLRHQAKELTAGIIPLPEAKNIK
ncbi:MAG: hypothetical protein WC742_04060 [Gallionellaceae bacterium]|jgi:hypothetical protein